jgi:hypothetical protein
MIVCWASHEAVYLESRMLSHTTAPARHRGLWYAQVVKTRAHGRIVQVDSTVVCGDPQMMAEQLTFLPPSATMNTSYVARPTLT